MIERINLQIQTLFNGEHSSVANSL